MIYIVVGMHRSGTSMLAGLLHQNGISMGMHFREPLPENPKGFFEEEAFRQVNERVLRNSGYVVSEWSPSYRGVSITAEDSEQARSLVTRSDLLSDSWGWKDPRTCLTLTMWLNALVELDLIESTKIIVIRRNIWSVAQSLLNRRNVHSLNHGAKIWRMYNRHLNRSLIECAVCPSVLEIRYERLIQRLDIDRLELFCDKCLDISFIDSALDHSGREKVR